MKKVLLLGDSICLGYGQKVKEMLSDIAEVKTTKENAQWTKYTYWNFELWAGEEHYDVIHWNNGIWDLHLIDNDEHFCSLEEYVRDNERLKLLISKYADTMIWATSTPAGKVLDQRKALNALANTNRAFKERFLTSGQKDWNRSIRVYNDAAIQLYQSLGVEIDDLHGVLSEHLEDYLSPDGIHPNAKGYDALASHVADVIRNALAETR